MLHKGLLTCLLFCLAAPLLAANAEPEMMTIKAGVFFMGSKDNDAASGEKPSHAVSLKSFNLSKTEITNAQFRQFAEATGFTGDNECYLYTKNGWSLETANWRKLPFHSEPQSPVVCVSWDDAKAYVQWLAKKTNKNYRLPTEAEWEYAARAGSTTKNYFGNSLEDLCKYGNIADSAGKAAQVRDTGKATKNFAACNDGAEYTNAVAQYQPNTFGLYDMLGNVNEWVEDCYHTGYAGAPVDGSAWVPEDCKYRSVRGGSWFHSPGLVRSSFIDWGNPGYRSTHFGFRIAETLPVVTAP
jgi:formylglycine-generating enzyme required for sulfatase activity